MYNQYRTINQQNLYEQIDNEISNLQQMKERMKNQQPMQPTNLTQNFQLAPTNREVIRYANSIDDVQKDNIVGETPYFSKDLSICWIKNLNGSIRSFELTEIIPKDEKDLKIEYLQAQIEELKKGMIKNEPNTDVDDTITKSIKNEKSSSISTIPKSKAK
jgi:hypothetical protein